MRAAQRAHAQKARSGSSLPRASHGNNSWNHSTPSPYLAASRVSSQSHKPRMRNRAPQQNGFGKTHQYLLNNGGRAGSNQDLLRSKYRSLAFPLPEATATVTSV